MIDLYFWPTSNGHKVTICLEEMALDYRILPIDITEKAQFDASFTRLNPNSKIPVIVDHRPADGGDKIAVFESGAILLYLAEKSGQFQPSDARAKLEMITWMFWQASGFGPMLGQAHHFNRKAPTSEFYGRERYNTEAQRLYRVLDKRLSKQEYILSDYTLADMMILPWVRRHLWQMVALEAFPQVQKWHDKLLNRPAIKRAYALHEAGA
jgi:GSH-dependent disulfide-bond oxidoreductase